VITGIILKHLADPLLQNHLDSISMSYCNNNYRDGETNLELILKTQVKDTSSSFNLQSRMKQTSAH
jgi:hypothetical protein